MEWNRNSRQRRGNADVVMAELGRLERDYTAGALSRDAFLESVSKVETLAYRNDIHPLHARAAWATLAGLALMAIWFSAESVFLDVAGLLGEWLEALALLGIAALVIAMVFLVASFRREAEDRRWFDGLRRTLLKGGRLIDHLEQGMERPET